MANWSGALQGALGGAGSGAALGSLTANPAGTAIGAAIGGLGGGLAGLFGGGGPGKMKQVQNLTPQQQQILPFLLQMGKNQVQNPYQGFQPIAQQARSQFQQNTIPSLAERFTSMGGYGSSALSSPAFASQLGSAGAGLEEALAALQAQYGMQNQRSGLSTLALGMSPAFENYYQGSQPGFGENLFRGSLQAAPSFYQSHMLSQLLANSQGQ